MSDLYDVVVIGGGVTGAGVARDAAMRGLKTLLLERGKPGMGTTAISTHLIHGGLRYLLYDRLTTHTTCWDSGHIVRIARPLLTRLPILWPVYRGQTHGLDTVETLLEVYDGFQEMKGGKAHLRLSAEETLKAVPGLKAEGLRGSVVFDEWWVDPVALVEANLDSARRFGAEVRTGTPVTGFLRSIGRIDGILTADQQVRGRIVINAAGPWIDKVAGLGGVHIPLRLQKGTHLLYKGNPRNSAGVFGGNAWYSGNMPMGLLLEAAGGGRFIFVIPSPQGTLVGPTDLPGPPDPDRVETSSEEVKYLLGSVKAYLPAFPERFDDTMVGSRPILGQRGSEKLLSREYEVFDHAARDGLEGFLTIGGGKMSDFRVMAEAAVGAACAKLDYPRPCRTHLETLAGEPVGRIPDFQRPWRPLKRFLRRHPHLRELHALGYLGAAFGRHLLAGGDHFSDADSLEGYYSD